MPKDGEICYARRRAGSSALPRFARQLTGAGGLSPASAWLPVTTGSPGDGASRDFKVSCSFHVSGPRTLSCVKQPKEAGIKEGEKIWVSDTDSWGQNEVNEIPFSHAAVLALSVSCRLLRGPWLQRQAQK